MTVNYSGRQGQMHHKSPKQLREKNDTNSPHKTEEHQATNRTHSLALAYFLIHSFTLQKLANLVWSDLSGWDREIGPAFGHS